MKTKKYMFWILLLLVSCSKPNKNSDILIDTNPFRIGVNDKQIDKIPHLSEFIDSIHYIPLETKEECLIGDISKILARNGLIYVNDKSSKSLYLFNYRGEYITKYSKVGGGPFEYQEIRDFIIDDLDQIHLLTEKSIIVLDQNLLPILQNNNKNIFSTMKFAYDGENYFLEKYSGDEIDVLSKENKVIGSFFKPQLYSKETSLKSFHSINNKILFKPSGNDTIFELNADKIMYHTIIDFEKPSKKEDEKIEESFGLKVKIISENVMHGVYYYSESNDYIHFRFNYNYKGYDGPFYALYSKQTKKSIIYTNEIQNDIYESKYPPMIRDVDDQGWFIAILDPYIYNSSNILNSKKLNIPNDANPIVTLVKFKSF